MHAADADLSAPLAASLIPAPPAFTFQYFLNKAPSMALLVQNRDGTLGCAAAKGLQPRAAARHKVMSKFGEFCPRGRFCSFFTDWDVSIRSCRIGTRFRLSQSEKKFEKGSTQKNLAGRPKPKNGLGKTVGKF